jgi:hypothetical protein
MTCKPSNKDAAALFYFVREYFATNHHQRDPTKPEQEQHSSPSEHASPTNVPVWNEPSSQVYAKKSTMLGNPKS